MAPASPGESLIPVVIVAQVGYAEDKDGVPEGWMALDIGPKSRAIVAKVMSEAQTILWNGYVHGTLLLLPTLPMFTDVVPIV